MTNQEFEKLENVQKNQPETVMVRGSLLKPKNIKRLQNDVLYLVFRGFRAIRLNLGKGTEANLETVSHLRKLKDYVIGCGACLDIIGGDHLPITVQVHLSTL